MNQPQLDLANMATVAPWLLAQTQMMGKNEAANQYDWQFLPEYDFQDLLVNYYAFIDMFDQDRGKWASFYVSEYRRALTDCMDSAEREEMREKMARWEREFSTDPQSRPIIAVEGPDGPPQFVLWDGAHRIGFAAGRGWNHIPMLYGTLKAKEDDKETP